MSSCVSLAPAPAFSSELNADVLGGGCEKNVVCEELETVPISQKVGPQRRPGEGQAHVHYKGLSWH